VLIRPAEAADWESIWPFFREIVTIGETYCYPDQITSESARSSWMTEAPGITVVAELEGRIVGSARIGPNRDGRGAHVATAAFMVDPRSQGEGVGRALAEFTLDWARTTGYRAMQFNAVVATNIGAVSLWKSLGFEILATVPEAFDHAADGLVGLHIMYRSLLDRPILRSESSMRRVPRG